MKRREFITLVGGAAVWPLAARAQQTTVPVIGFLRNTDALSSQPLVTAFRRGLHDSGYVEGQNVAIEYRWADGHDEKMPELARDLVQHHVAIIVAGGGSVVALATKRATATIPVVFELGGDPVKMGLVASLNHPGGNLTGVALFSNTIGSKRAELLLSLVPQAKAIGLVVDPNNPNAAREIKQVQETTGPRGIALDVLNAGSKSEIDVAFTRVRDTRPQGLIVMATPLFVAHRQQFVQLAARNAIPTIYPFPSFAKAGGLMSYGDDLNDAFRQVGLYTGRILKGQRPADLPVVQPSKFQFVLNLKTAKALSLNVPSKVLAVADEVIE